MSRLIAPKRRINRLTEPQVLFPIVAAVLLAVIWGTTLSLMSARHADAERAAAISSRELLATYEAQVVRALREIQQTLELVRFWREHEGRGHRLAELAENGLLPPELVFAVSIADRSGDIVDIHGEADVRTIADQDFFREQREGAGLYIGQVPQGAQGEVTLHFSRQLQTPDGEFDGVVVIALNAGYFVSGYESAQLGTKGVLGLLGDDGIFRVRRTGEQIFSGEVVDYAALLAAAGDEEDLATISISSWDGLSRWTSARELFGFPLAVILGISVDEVKLATREDIRSYVWQGALGSLVALILTGILGYMSWQIARGRERESEAKVAYAERVEYLAYHDGLTGLPNRSMFSRLLIQSLNGAQGPSGQQAVAFLDLDRFKQINDTLGHEAGDTLLREVATRLKTCVRDGDTVARLGGDEFVVLLPDLGADGKYAEVVAQRIMSALAQPFTLVGQQFRVSASIGISIYPQHGLDEQTLTKNADIAMYKAKAEGKNNYQFYSDELNASTLERLALEASMRHALERGEFKLHFQARRDIATGMITGMEALLRWEHPDLGTVAPMRFIPVAEETGLIVLIGKWVLKTACQQNMQWKAQGMDNLGIAINLTTRQFLNEHLVEDVRAVLEDTGMEPRLLELEIQEGLLTQNTAATLRILKSLKRLGVRIAVDGFGRGYSSLATLKQFPLDTIKVDRALIRDLASSNEDRGLADAIIAMGKSLAVTVVAQGVETQEQARYLQAHAFDELQGFYFNRPLPADLSTQLLLAQSAGVTYTGKRLGLSDVE